MARAAPDDGNAVPRERDLDLVQLALELIGRNQLSEVINRSLRVLREPLPGSTWAILHSVGPRRYEVALRGPAGHADLRQLAQQACGKPTWLAIGRALADEQSLGRPVFTTVAARSGTSGDGPDLVLAVWGRDGLHQKIDPLQLVSAARMIASAIASSEAFENLLKQSSRDPLTGLLNRRAILDSLRRERARAQRTRRPLSVLFIDVDGFKTINDRHGHLVGDELLIALSRRLAGALRQSDGVGRYGGDEFLIVLPDAELETARRIGERLEALAPGAPFETTAGTMSVTLTWGAASIRERAGRYGLIERADRRMLAGKRRSTTPPAEAARPEAVTAAPVAGG